MLQQWTSYFLLCNELTWQNPDDMCTVGVCLALSVAFEYYHPQPLNCTLYDAVKGSVGTDFHLYGLYYVVAVHMLWWVRHPSPLTPNHNPGSWPNRLLSLSPRSQGSTSRPGPPGRSQYVTKHSRSGTWSHLILSEESSPELFASLMKECAPSFDLRK